MYAAEIGYRLKLYGPQSIPLFLAQKTITPMHICHRVCPPVKALIQGQLSKLDVGGRLLSSTTAGDGSECDVVSRSQNGKSAGKDHDAREVMMLIEAQAIY
jgi:hypothetical protein